MILGPAQTLPVDQTAVDVDALTVPGILHGWAWHNPSLVARADLTLTDGPNGALIVPISLSPGQSTRDWLSGTGIQIVAGITVHVVSGTVEGALWFRPLEVGELVVPFDVRDALDAIVDSLWSR